MKSSATVSIAALVATVLALPKDHPNQQGSPRLGLGSDVPDDLLVVANDNDCGSQFDGFGARAFRVSTALADGSVGAGEG